ncbi:hypothetical protein MTYM_01594 [Methylococcales bacterium]|nr:hypothetical protein MTYM_01594 [Methylococcales bacterium]
MNAIQIVSNTSDYLTTILAGNCGYKVQGDRIVITIGEIANLREQGEISGTLAIEVWALERPYAGGQFDGVALAGTSIGELHGKHSLTECRYDLIFQAPPPGHWHLTLMLREWTNLGYITRDYLNFNLPYIVEKKPVFSRIATDNVINVEFAKNKTAPVAQSNGNFASGNAEPSQINTSATSETDAKKDTAISINSASFEEILAIKGMSKKLAENILESRPYDTFEQLLKVKGIGEKLLEKMKHFIKL